MRQCGILKYNKISEIFSHYVRRYIAKTGICEIYAKHRMPARIVMYTFCTFVPFTSIARFMNGKCNDDATCNQAFICDRKAHSRVEKSHRKARVA